MFVNSRVCYIKPNFRTEHHSAMSSGPPPPSPEQLVEKQAGELCAALRLLRAEKGKLTGGNVTWACARVSDELAKLTKTLVDLDFTVQEIRAREQQTLPLSRRKPIEIAEDAPEPRRSTPFGEPAMTACIR